MHINIDLSLGLWPQGYFFVFRHQKSPKNSDNNCGSLRNSLPQIISSVFRAFLLS
jgi:hypothetical protein